MKKIILIFLAMIVISCSSSKSEFTQIAKTSKLVSIDGSEIAFENILKKHEGKTILIEVWAAWCSDCVKNMPKIKAIQTKNPNVDYVFLSADKTPESWKAGIEKYKIVGENYLISDGMQGVFGNAINLDWIPRYIIIDKTGKIIIYKAIETDFDKVNETLKSLE